MKIIYLIGYMGSGKTTLGRVAAECLNMDFIDLDEYVELRQSMSVSEIFARGGEAMFRQLESEALGEIAQRASVSGGTIVACGGGTPLRAENIELMNSTGVTVWLQASVERLIARLKECRANRPLIATLSDAQLREHIVAGLEQRSHWYARAKMRFDSSLLDTPVEIEHTLEKFNREIVDNI